MSGVEHASSSPCSYPLGSTQDHALSQESSETGCKGKILLSLWSELIVISLLILNLYMEIENALKFEVYV